jgi:hypothetical protein
MDLTTVRLASSMGRSLQTGSLRHPSDLGSRIVTGSLLVRPELVEQVGVSLVDGDLGDLSVMDLELNRHDYV